MVAGLFRQFPARRECTIYKNSTLSFYLGKVMRRSIYEGKPCQQCHKIKGKNQQRQKFCYSCARERKKISSKVNHEKRILKLYQLTEGQYDELYEIQGGKCAICRRATGKSRRLSVDHDHATDLVRGLLCRKDNDLLGHARDQIEFFQRAIDYLENPPANNLKKSSIEENKERF